MKRVLTHDQLEGLDSPLQMYAWYYNKPHPLALPLEFYDVTLQCPERKDLEGEYVVQFSSPGPFKVRGMDGLLRWEWSLHTIRKIGYQKKTAQLEVEVGRLDLMYLSTRSD